MGEIDRIMRQTIRILQTMINRIIIEFFFTNFRTNLTNIFSIVIY